jgi:tRNA-dihydrouridine synthase 2
MGSALLTQPQKVYDILKNLVNNIKKPITCKIRVLPSLEDTLELVKLIESTGVEAIAVHGRTKEERPQNPNRNNVIKAIAQTIKIPVIANGGSSHIDMNTDIEKFRLETCASSVMIARAAQKNCSIFLKQDFLLPIDDVIKEYLKFAIDFDNNVINTKYCIQQMLGPLQETTRGKALLAAQQMKTICQLWQMEDYFDEKEKIKREFDHKLLDCNQICDNETNFSVKRRKIFKEKQLIEMPVIFVRTLFGENDLPKSLLMSWTLKKSIKPPEYRTTQIEKHFNTIVTVDGKCYSSSYLEKSKKYSEQCSALVALFSLDLIHNFDLMKQCLAKNVNHITITNCSHTFYIKTS